MKTHITSLQLRGFKSFNRKTELVFCPGLNVVIGPNGSGKSNIGDAICFGLGRISSKDLRAENFSDLLFKRKENIAAEGEITYILNNSSKTFPIEEKLIEIKRRIKKTGQAQFKLNGRNATRQQILELLGSARIFPDGHNIILQGDIARFVDMKPIEKRMLIEEIAGIGSYEERKNKALSELQKVDEKLKEAQIVLAEKEAYMKGLEKEKEEAEKYKVFKDELEALKAAEILLRIKNAESRKEGTITTINNCSLDSEVLKSKINEAEKKIESLQEDAEHLEKAIKKKGGEEALAIQQQAESLKVEAQKYRTLIEGSFDAVKKAEARISELNSNSESISKKINEKESEKSKLEKELQNISKTEEALKKETDASSLKALEKDINSAELALEALKETKDRNFLELSRLQSDLRIIEHKISANLEKIAGIEEREKKLIELKDSKAKYKSLVEEISKLASQDSKLALELGELKKELIKTESQLMKTRVHQSSIQEILMRDRAIKEIIDSRKKISGVLGTVAELGKVDKKYSEALKVAAGQRMKNIVVEDSDTAIKCLGILKDAKAGIATFLPLDKLRIPEISKEIEKLKEKKGVLGLAYEFVSCDKKYKGLFRFVFRDSIIIEDIPTAKSLGIGKFRMITLSGDLFEASGAITGGFRHRESISFESEDASKEIEALESEISAIQSKIKSSEQERIRIETNIMDLRRQKAELEGFAEATRGISAMPKEEIEKEIKNLKEKKNSAEKQIKSIEKELKELDNEISEKVGERNFLKIRLHKFQFGEQSREIEELLKRKSEAESMLSGIKATLENALYPEKGETEKVLRATEKEKKDFERQISEYEKALKKLDEEIGIKEKERESFQGKLNELLAKKDEIWNQIRQEETKLGQMQVEVKVKESEKNNLAVLKAEIEGEIAGLQKEFEPFRNVKPAEIKSADGAKRKIRELEVKITTFGNINFRALEVFDAIKKEYDELSEKVQKLDSEKKDVLGMIAEIETKKKDAFMKTYSAIQEKFAVIHEKIANGKTKAKMHLENEEEPFAGGILVSITDSKGKKLSVVQLSGGEKVLVALSLIFAIQELEPAPFYLLDEIDATLDKVNSEKVAQLLKEYSQKAQIIIITHNDAVTSVADNIFGVHMKDGESNVVGLKV